MVDSAVPRAMMSLSQTRLQRRDLRSPRRQLLRLKLERAALLRLPQLQSNSSSSNSHRFLLVLPSKTESAIWLILKDIFILIP